MDVRACLVLFLGGFVKKACVSDAIAPTVDQFFAAPGHYGLLSAWLGVLLYAVQIYADFSGYTDMALACAGSARLPAGVELRFSLPRAGHRPILAALAHEPVELAARLSLHPARRQSRRALVHCAKPPAHHAPRRPVARGSLAFRVVGRAARRGVGRASGMAAAHGRTHAQVARRGRSSRFTGCACAGCFSARRTCPRRGRSCGRSCFATRTARNVCRARGLAPFPVRVPRTGPLAQCPANVAGFWERLPDWAFAAVYGVAVAVTLLFVPQHYAPFIYFQF